ncbi:MULTISPECIES: hypothetical protein [Candidatus Nitrosocaldus]|jgi:hypothetical protein|uniref:Uncharacterized protein n=1 Tax=Candidatus Nitrosocaldus cavascurensis TaxID=2058097 RepID=A0A2K5APV2_9ARCH|nr:MULTISPECIES: hypothetical protein [Candidatus Nitrosocaldus]GBC74053.1 hypothetical protein HRbin05_00084 [archaeon HR05]SPC33664.1 protein of unknown function [Candidatus Nitrosocaldus cavascurensis]
MNTFILYKEGKMIRRVDIVGEGVDEDDPIVRALLSVVRTKGDSVVFKDISVDAVREAK